ncbi:hypothetical protein PINS_up015359 [Pythium insidiosum]|nr:hypothetical protein PINS_up015359 [Pythium insidiosum]
MATKEIFNDLNLVLRLNQHIEELTSSREAAAALLHKESSFKVLAELSSLRTPETREDAQFDHQRVDFLASNVSNLPFHLQGDAAFNEAGAMAKRRQLRHSDAIKERIAFLWSVARGKKNAELTRRTNSSRASSSSTSSTAAALSGAMASISASINEQEYTEMMLLVFKVLRDDFVLDTAHRQIACDWEVDSHHGDALTFEQFFAAFFELVDVWTCDVLEATYTRFLELLARRITLRVVVFLDDMKLKLALSDNFDEAVVVKAIPLKTIKQFASVARLMESSGVRTVGELADADPRAVESQRLAFLQRGDVSREKIGGDIQNLLAMFREVSQQFQQTNYVLKNMVLQRLPTQSQVAGAAFTNAPLGVSSGGGDAEASSLSGVGVGVGVGAGSVLIGREAAGHERAHSTAFSAAVQSDRTVLGAPTTSHGTGDSVSPVVRRGIKRINTLHDLSGTETEVIDALKASFLIEKGIALQRRSDLSEIMAELRKFGVDPTGLSDAAARERYDSLYEMFVLRDGENIRSLAQTVLARIKMELAAHGIVVNDDEAEAMYDGFYGSIVDGSGEKIVTDAKNWVSDAVKNRSASAYIKEDYHELKPINEVKTLGTEAGDGEFLALLSTEEDDDEAPSHRSDAHSIAESTQSTETKVGVLSKGSSISRSMSRRRMIDATGVGKSPVELSTQGIVSEVQDGVRASDQSYSRVKASSSEATGSLPPMDTTDMVQTLEPPSSQAQTIATSSLAENSSSTMDAANRPSTSDSEVIDETSLEYRTTDGSAEYRSNVASSVEEEQRHTILTPAVNSEDTTEDVVDVDDSVDQSSAATVVVLEQDDDAFGGRKKTAPLLMSTRSRQDLVSDANAKLDEMHVVISESAREPQGVDFEYEEKAVEAPVELPPVIPERCV